MREILFRGRMLTGEWVYGDLRNDIKGSTKYWDTCSQRICWECSNAPVENGTVGQYTGLKDKNGTEIYEGDIVQNIYGDIFTVGYYGEHWYGYVLTTSDGCVDHLYEYDEYEVIGNIHDNPELVEEELK